uniref:YncE family protein n=1 Tax=candidate division WOR-3 bacterium TaxID=2052148 RepID=A0A7C4GEQ2_UNCW3
MLPRLLLAALCAKALTAQTLDTVVRFPYEVRELFHVPEGNKLYVSAFVRDSGTDHIYILDCADMAVRKVIPTGTLSVYAGDHRAAWCPSHNKVYMSFSGGYPDTGVLAVIDNATDSVLLRLPVGAYDRAITYNPVWDKLYCAALLPLPSVITVLDCAADTVLKTIVLPEHRAGKFAVWDSAGDKMYFGGGGWTNADRVTVVDCRTDSVVAVIPSRVAMPGLAAYNPLRRKLYVGSSWDEWGVSVIDCATDSVIKRFSNIFTMIDGVPVYCSAEDKVYWLAMSVTQNKPDTINVIDCATDSIVRMIPCPAPDRAIWYIAYAPWNNRLYVASNHLLTVFDCRNDSMIGQARLGSSPCEVLCNPVDRRIYVSVFWDSAVYVFREDLQPVSEESWLRPPSPAILLRPNPARDVVWLSGPAPRALYSVCGQRLLSLMPGRNELPASLPDGVYFARGPQGPPSQKVVIRR